MSFRATIHERLIKLVCISVFGAITTGTCALMAGDFSELMSLISGHEEIIVPIGALAGGVIACLMAAGWNAFVQEVNLRERGSGRQRLQPIDADQHASPLVLIISITVLVYIFIFTKYGEHPMLILLNRILFRVFSNICFGTAMSSLSVALMAAVLYSYRRKLEQRNRERTFRSGIPDDSEMASAALQDTVGDWLRDFCFFF